MDKLKIIEKEEEDDDVNECEEEDDVKECEEENIKHHDEDKEEEEEGRKEGRQKAITGLLWCGTSLSDHHGNASIFQDLYFRQINSAQNIFLSLHNMFRHFRP